MKADSILEETWRVKEQLARDADYDIQKIFNNLRAHERAHPEVPRILTVDDLRRLAQRGDEQMALRDKQR